VFQLICNTQTHVCISETKYFFAELTITVGAQNVSLLLLKTRKKDLLKRWYDTTLRLLTFIDIIVSCMFCLSSFSIWGLFEYTLS
jgi:hypothetical protein